jgi:HK97 family phage prohead protease
MLQRKTLSLSDCGISFKANDDEQSNCSFSGYASVFNGTDSYSDRILPGAYQNILREIQTKSARMPKMFINHKSWDLPIGKWVNLCEDDMGLKADGELTVGNPTSDAVAASLQHGTIDGLSIGFRLEAGDTETIQESGQSIRLIKNISELVEISVVTFPADEEARVDLVSVKTALEAVHSIRDFENFLRESGGFSKSLAMATARQAKRVFDQREAGQPLELPTELRRQIVENLTNSQI